MNPEKMQGTPWKTKDKGEDWTATQRKQPEMMDQVHEYTYQQQSYDQDDHQQLERRYPLYSSLDLKSKQKILRNCLDHSNYSQASNQQKTIKYLTSHNKSQIIRQRSAQHALQRTIITQCHKKQVHRYRKAWEQIFGQYRTKEQEKIYELNRVNYEDRKNCEMRIMQRCLSEKMSVKVAKIRQLEKQEKLLRKTGRTGELRRIRSQKKHQIQQYQKDLQLRYTQIIKQQNNQYQNRQTKRLNSLKQKLYNQKQDTQRKYRQGQKVLKQKFKNVMINLKHEQIIEMNQLLKNGEFDFCY